MGAVLKACEVGHLIEPSATCPFCEAPPDTYCRKAQETINVRLYPLLELLTELHQSDYLSEQQCARLLGWDLLTWRKR